MNPFLRSPPPISLPSDSVSGKWPDLVCFGTPRARCSGTPAPSCHKGLGKPIQPQFRFPSHGTKCVSWYLLFQPQHTPAFPSTPLPSVFLHLVQRVLDIQARGRQVGLLALRRLQPTQELVRDADAKQIQTCAIRVCILFRSPCDLCVCESWRSPDRGRQLR